MSAPVGRCADARAATLCHQNVGPASGASVRPLKAVRVGPPKVVRTTHLADWSKPGIVDRVCRASGVIHRRIHGR
jgi:hypothetical protein